MRTACLLLALLCFGCSNPTIIDDTPASISVQRHLCCGDSGRDIVLGHDPVEYWLARGATQCTLDGEKQVWLGLWVIEQTWTCYGPRWVFGVRT